MGTNLNTLCNWLKLASQFQVDTLLQEEREKNLQLQELLEMKSLQCEDLKPREGWETGVGDFRISLDCSAVSKLAGLGCSKSKT